MIVSIHQPNFLPYTGFFNKILSSDIFILYDTAQYVKNRWDNRNRLRNKGGSFYITIPLTNKSYFRKSFFEIPLPDDNKWKRKHKLMIQSSYSRSNFFEMYFEDIIQIYDSRNTNLADFNFKFINFFLKSFEIETKVVKASDLNLSKSFRSSKFLAEAVEQVGGQTYLSGPSGSNYMDINDFDKKNLSVVFQDYKCKTYKQNFPGFINHLSSLDLLFNLGPKARDLLV